MQDMTVGSIKKHIFTFSFPLLISNILQLVNLLVNRVWAGKFLGEESIGAIAVSSIVIYIMFSLSIGLTIGTGTVISQYFGAKQHDKIGKTVTNSFAIVFIIAVIMSFLIVVLSKPILLYMDTPEGIMVQAQEYLIITSLGLVFLFEQILIGFLFRSIGDSVTPLIFSGISVIINAALDPFLMLGIYPFPRMEVKGAAIALIISQAVALFIAIYYMQKKGGFISFRKKYLVYDKEVVRNILKLGTPSAIQNVVVSTGISINQIYVDSYGTSAVASFAAVAVPINIILYVSWSISAGVSVISGQNMGANNIERVKETLKHGLLICLYFTLFVSLVCLLIPKAYLYFFLPDNAYDAIKFGIDGSRILALPFLFLVSMVIFDSLFNGVGDTMTAMFITIVGIWVIRIPSIAIFTKLMGIDGIWVGLGLSYIISGIISFCYYKSGRWQTKSIIKHNHQVACEI